MYSNFYKMHCSKATLQKMQNIYIYFNYLKKCQSLAFKVILTKCFLHYVWGFYAENRKSCKKIIAVFLQAGSHKYFCMVSLALHIWAALHYSSTTEWLSHTKMSTESAHGYIMIHCSSIFLLSTAYSCGIISFYGLCWQTFHCHSILCNSIHCYSLNGI